MRGSGAVIKMPDGTKVTLVDWRHEAYYSCTPHFLIPSFLLPKSEPVLVQPGYTLGPDNDEVPAPVSLAEFARQNGLSEWRLRSNVAEYQALERKGRSSSRVWRRLASLLSGTR